MAADSTRCCDIERDPCPAGSRDWQVHDVTDGPAVIALARAARACFLDSARVVDVPAPALVIGDLHGDSEDLAALAETLWPAGPASLDGGGVVFLGDYVDRGADSVGVTCTLFAMKLAHPDKVTLLRGNHEDRHINGDPRCGGHGCLQAECAKRYGSGVGAAVWCALNDAFDCLPIAAVVGGAVLCAHGGVPTPRPPDDIAEGEVLGMLRAAPVPLHIPRGWNRAHVAATLPLPARLAIAMLWADAEDLPGHARYLATLLSTRRNHHFRAPRCGIAAVDDDGELFLYTLPSPETRTRTRAQVPTAPTTTPTPTPTPTACSLTLPPAPVVDTPPAVALAVPVTVSAPTAGTDTAPVSSPPTFPVTAS